MPVKTDLKRFEKTISNYEQYPIEQNKILLYGSSFFAKWGFEQAKADLAGICGEENAVVNHGFGGSTGEEQMYYYDRMVKPYAPKMIILRGCANDISRGYTPDEAVEFSMRMYSYAKADFPSIKFAVLTAFDFKSAVNRNGMVEGMKYYNSKIAEYAAQSELYPDLYMINNIPELYENPEDAGTYKGFKDIFLDDGLHFAPEIYKTVWAPFFKREITKILEA